MSTSMWIPGCSASKLPTFTLQPLVENAVKHGTSSLLENGKIVIHGYREAERIVLEVEDNAGNYAPDRRRKRARA